MSSEETLDETVFDVVDVVDEKIIGFTLRVKQVLDIIETDDLVAKLLAGDDVDDESEVDLLHALSTKKSITPFPRIICFGAPKSGQTTILTLLTIANLKSYADSSFWEMVTDDGDIWDPYDCGRRLVNLVQSVVSSLPKFRVGGEGNDLEAMAKFKPDLTPLLQLDLDGTEDEDGEGSVGVGEALNFILDWDPSLWEDEDEVERLMKAATQLWANSLFRDIIFEAVKFGSINIDTSLLDITPHLEEVLLEQFKPTEFKHLFWLDIRNIREVIVSNDGLPLSIDNADPSRTMSCPVIAPHTASTVITSSEFEDHKDYFCFAPDRMFAECPRHIIVCINLNNINMYSPKLTPDDSRDSLLALTIESIEAAATASVFEDMKMSIVWFRGAALKEKLDGGYVKIGDVLDTSLIGPGFHPETVDTVKAIFISILRKAWTHSSSIDDIKQYSVDAPIDDFENAEVVALAMLNEFSKDILGTKNLADLLLLQKIREDIEYGDDTSSTTSDQPFRFDFGEGEELDDFFNAILNSNFGGEGDSSNTHDLVSDAGSEGSNDQPQEFPTAE